MNNELNDYTGLLEELARRTDRRRLYTYYPDEGPLRRELYPKHQAFLAAGLTNRIRMMMAATSKSGHPGATCG